MGVAVGRMGGDRQHGMGRPVGSKFNLVSSLMSGIIGILIRSHGKLTDGSSVLALDGAEPLLKNCKGNASGRVVDGEINPFPRSFHLMSCFKNSG
jgi:hypothetical protein